MELSIRWFPVPSSMHGNDAAREPSVQQAPLHQIHGSFSFSIR